VKTWSKSITRRPHGAVASLLVNPDTHGLSQNGDFPQLPKHRGADADGQPRPRGLLV
jgi:hypothetical protein